MDYSKKQIAKLLKLQGKLIKKTGRTYGEDQQARLLKHQHKENHKMYMHKKAKKLTKQQHLNWEFKTAYSYLLFHLDLTPANYKKIDNLLNFLAKSQGGVLKLSQLRKLLLSHMDGKKGFKEVSNYLTYENANNPSAFIKGYNKSMPNVNSILDALATGFLGAKDIKYDLGLRTIRQATYILTPVDDYVKKLKLKSIGSWENHIPDDDIVTVHDVIQDKPSEHKSTKYGMHTSQKVVSTSSYLRFLNLDYKSAHKTPKYVKSHYTKDGQAWIKAIKATKPSQRLDRMIRAFSARIYLTIELRVQTKISNLCLDRLKHPEKLIEPEDNHNFWNSIDKLEQELMNYYKKWGHLSFRKQFATNTKSKLMNRFVKNEDIFNKMAPEGRPMLFRMFL